MHKQDVKAIVLEGLKLGTKAMLTWGLLFGLTMGLAIAHYDGPHNGFVTFIIMMVFLFLGGFFVGAVVEFG